MKKDRKIGLICSPGGRFTEILRLVEVFENYSKFLVACKEKATLNRKNIWFSVIDFVKFGKSVHNVLNNLDTGEDQIALNTYVEITK